MGKVWFVDPQLKLFMKSVNGQFARFQNIMTDMREELREIKACQSASAPRDDMCTLPQNLHGCKNDEYRGDTYCFRGGRLHPIKGGRGRGGGGCCIPIQQYVEEEEGTEAATSSQLDGNFRTINRKMPDL
jgi:hypothetical protein